MARTDRTDSSPSAKGYLPSTLAGLTIVAISDGGHNFGLYRVKHVEPHSMVLSHGAFSFPVGTHLDVEDFKYQAPGHASFHQRATVVENDRDGLRLVW